MLVGMRIQWNWGHTLAMVGATLVAATAGYIEQQDATSLLAALESWAAFKVMLVHMVVIDLVALAVLFKQSPMVASATKAAAVFVLATSLAACAGAIAAVVPVADLGICVAEHALNGESIPDIARDCKQDIPAVINALLESKKPEVRTTRAYGEALQIRGIFVRDP